MLRIGFHIVMYWKARITHRKSFNRAGFIMITKAVVFFLSALLALSASALASAVSEKDFSAETTQNLLNLATAAQDGPLYEQDINMFIDWAKAHPQYLKDKPVETEFRFLMGKWPCKP